MKLEGSLDAFSLPDIFQLLSFTKKSGGLRLRHGPADGVVFFAEGFVTGASADGVRQALARRLIGSGAVDDETLGRAVHAAAEGRGVGPWLVESGAIDADLVRQAATEQTVDSVFDLLRWPAGDFSFNVDGVNPDDVGVRLATEQVVAEATQRQASWEAVAAVIPGPDTVLSMPVVLGVEPSVSRDEWALLALVDGRRRVGDLVELTGCGQFAVVSTLAALVGRGLLQVRTDDDHVATVQRRQALLAPLEGDPEPPGGSAETGTSSEEAAPHPVAAEGSGAGQAEESGDGGTSAATADATSEAASEDSEEADDDSEEASDDDLQPEATAPADGPSPQGPAGWGAGARATAAGPARAPEPAPALVRAHAPGDVVPPRPEPFLPSRRPEHAEAAPAARLTGLPSVGPSVGNAAVATDPDSSGLIERDPSVNRSLLLRLIAGVRGL